MGCKPDPSEFGAATRLAAGLWPCILGICAQVCMHVSVCQRVCVYVSVCEREVYASWASSRVCMSVFTRECVCVCMNAYIRSGYVYTFLSIYSWCDSLASRTSALKCVCMSVFARYYGGEHICHLCLSVCVCTCLQEIMCVRQCLRERECVCTHTICANVCVYVSVCESVFFCVHVFRLNSDGRCTECLEVQGSFRKRATNYRALLREMTYRCDSVHVVICICGVVFACVRVRGW